MKRLFTMIFTAIYLCMFPLSATAIHLLILADTTDRCIGPIVTEDAKHMEHCFSYLASASKIPLHVTKLTSARRNLSREHIMRWVRKQHFASDDVVILYYTGHGMRKRISPTIWPGVNIPNRETNEEYVALEPIIRKLILKKAALCIVLLDCCNVMRVDSTRSQKSSRHELATELKRFDKKLIARNCKKLLTTPYGFIVAAASSPREFGQCLADERHVLDHCPAPIVSSGSVFTAMFLNNFFEDLQSADPQWSNIFKKTKSACVEITMDPENYLLDDVLIRRFDPPHKHQTPQAKFFLYKHRRGRAIYLKHLFEECTLEEGMHSKASVAECILLDSSDKDLESDFDISSIQLHVSQPE